MKFLYALILFSSCCSGAATKTEKVDSYIAAITLPELRDALKCLQKIADSGKPINGLELSPVDQKPTTPLVFACSAFAGREEYTERLYQIVLHLLTQKADPNIAGCNSLTPIFFAVKSADLTLLKLLCDRGATADSFGDWQPSAYGEPRGLMNPWGLLTGMYLYGKANTRDSGYPHLMIGREMVRQGIAKPAVAIPPQTILHYTNSARPKFSEPSLEEQIAVLTLAQKTPAPGESITSEAKEDKRS